MDGCGGCIDGGLELFIVVQHNRMSKIKKRYEIVFLGVGFGNKCRSTLCS
jgi:hypothetical protein